MAYSKAIQAPFIAWDGEGYTDNDGNHHYMLFGNSEGQKVRGESLTWKECFPLLLKAPKDANHIIYGGDYDVIMMIKPMPKNVRQRLHDGEIVWYKGYRLRWLRRKWFDISMGKRSVRLYDVISFFQTSFVKACRSYLGESDALDRMHEMKLQRDSFIAGDDKVIEYWLSELDYLVRLMTELRNLLLTVDIRPKGWFGPGAIANAILKREGVKEHFGNIDAEVIERAERAYYGGRFEQFKVGRVTNAYEYDIRSAYPDAIRRLPSLKDCVFHRWNREDEIHPFGLYSVTWNLTRTNGKIGPLPYRSTKGNIYFPMHCDQPSWYWGIEIGNLYSYPSNEWKVHEGWVPKFAGGDRPVERPFTFVESMYNERKRMKAEGIAAERALKLGLNSLYGKLAQSKGAVYTDEGWKLPTYHNALYAGWITAATRARLFATANERSGAIVAMETDAIFTSKPLDLDIGTDLGQWEVTEIPDLLYIDSGVYYLLTDNGGWQIKSRGVEVDRMLKVDYWKGVFDKLPYETVEITVGTRRFVTDLKSKEYGNWRDYKRTTVLPRKAGKRVHIPKFCLLCRDAKYNPESRQSYLDWAHILVVPPCGSKKFASTPYAFPWRETYENEWEDAIELEAWTYSDWNSENG